MEMVNLIRNGDKADIHISVEQALFRSLDINNSGFISKSEWIRRLNDAGIQSDDIRIKSLIHALSGLADIDFDIFFKVVKNQDAIPIVV